MPQVRFAWRRYAGPLAITAMLGAFWLWVFAVQRLNLETRGVRGLVTAVLWTLYLFAVPLAGVVTLLATAVGAGRRRDSWRSAAPVMLFAAVSLGFWWWSVTKAGG